MKRMLCALLAVVLLLSAAPMGMFNLTASAAVVTIPTVSVGETWSQSWNAESTSFRLSISQTGFYKATVTDRNTTGYFYIEIDDLTTEETLGYIAPWQIIGNHMSKEMFLLSGHTYEITCHYVNWDEEAIPANMAMVFNRYNVQLAQIPSGSVNTSTMSLQFGDEDNWAWLKFTTTAAGDYSFNFTNLHAFVSVYKAATGEEVYDGVDTEYWNYYSEVYNLKNCLIFNLAANTEYYVYVRSYEATSAKVSMTQNSKTVKTIVANNVIYDINSFWDWWDIDSGCFDYKVTYTNNSYEVLDYYTVSRNGYTVPYIQYIGGIVETDEYSYEDEEYVSYLRPGNQPVASIYNDQETTVYVNVKSLVHHVKDLSVMGEDDYGNIDDKADGEHNYWWHVRVDESGMFGIYTSGSDGFSTNFDYYSIKFFDDQNNVVPYDANSQSWPLLAGREYALSIRYIYDSEYNWNDVRFQLGRSGSQLVGVDGWVVENGKWAYYRNGWKVTSTWMADSTGWCYIGANGYMLTNEWVRDSVGWCYVGANGYCVTNEWKKDSNGWCYLDENGRMAVNRWVKDSVGWCYVGADGYCVTSCWKKDSVGWCYLDANGRMATNQWVRDSVGWCYVGADGYAVTNCWKRDSHGWCYLNSEGSMTKNSWVWDAGAWYYVDGNGYMLSNTSRVLGGKRYYFNASGVCTNP